jgi:ParB family chromosome partitioning protein
MVDSNLQRESILPSEKAFAYKMKLEAMKRQGQRTDLTSAQLGRKLDGKESREILAEQAGESRNQISRYIRLTSLLPSILEMVDEKHIAFNPAVELSYLAENEQQDLYNTMQSEDCTPSLAQAQRMKKLSQEARLMWLASFSRLTEKPISERKFKSGVNASTLFSKELYRKAKRRFNVNCLKVVQKRRR